AGLVEQREQAAFDPVGARGLERLDEGRFLLHELGPALLARERDVARLPHLGIDLQGAGKAVTAARAADPPGVENERRVRLVARTAAVDVPREPRGTDERILRGDGRRRLAACQGKNREER